MGTEHVDFLLTGGTVITQNRTREIIPAGAVAVHKDAIKEVGPADAISERFSAGRTIDCTDKYLFPGLIDTHTHQFQNFIKGVGQGLKLFDWVEAITEPAARLMTERECYLASAIGMIQAAHSGTTTVLDYMYPLPASDMYSHFAQAYIDTGIRGVLGWGFLDCGEQHHLPQSLMRPIRRVLEDLENSSIQKDVSTLSTALAPGVVFGISDAGMEELKEFALHNNLLITFHLNETDIDNEAVGKDHGKTAIKHLEDLGLLNPRLLAVHCVKMRPEELDLFADRGVKVAHAPSSNMYLGSGIAPVLDMVEKGVSVGLATDTGGSNSNDMLEVLEDAAYLQKVAREDPAVITAQDVLDMATLGGAAALGREGELGSLEAGKKADLFLFDPYNPRSVPVLDPVASLVFSAGPENIEMTMVEGVLVMEDRSMCLVDEPALLRESQKAAQELADRSGTTQLFMR